MCMFTGNLKNADQSFKEFKKENNLSQNVQSNKRAPWKSHQVIIEADKFKKFLGFDEEEYSNEN